MYLASSQKQEHMYLKAGSQFLSRCFFLSDQTATANRLQKDATEIMWSGDGVFAARIHHLWMMGEGATIKISHFLRILRYVRQERGWNQSNPIYRA